MSPGERGRLHAPGTAELGEPLPVAPDPSAQGAQGDDSEPSEPWGYYVGECGHRVPGGPVFYIGPCEDCDADATSPPPAHPGPWR